MKINLLRVTFLIICCFISITSSYAVKAYRNVVSIKQPDGTFVSIKKIGDEFTHDYATEDGYFVRKCNDGFFRYIYLDDNNIEAVSNFIAKNKKNRSLEEKDFLANVDSKAIFEVMSQKSKNLKEIVENSRRENLKNFKARNVASRRASKFLQNSLPPSTRSSNLNKGLVLLVEYNDVKFTSGTSAFYNDMLNLSGFTQDGALGSVKDYFEAQSDNQFSPTFDVVGPITLSKNMAYYGANSGNYELKVPVMIAEACSIAYTVFNVDFSQYSSGNKIRLGKPLVDLVYVIYAGYGENFTGVSDDAVWPHASNLIDWNIRDEYNNVMLDDYACSAELWGNAGSELCGIGIVCHEFSHTLGLMDLYNTVDANDFCWNEWSVMDEGNYLGKTKKPIGYSAFEKYSVGWIEPTELTTGGSYSLQNLAESGEAYKLSLNDDEYFLFENRQPTGWDVEMPAKQGGMLISRVAYDRTKWNSNVINTNPQYYKKRVIIMPADNSPMSTTMSADLYPGPSRNTEFTSTSSPKSIYYSDSIIDKPITNIRLIGNLVTFDFALTSDIDDFPYSDKKAIYTQGNEVYVNNVNDDKAYVYNVIGKLVKVVPLNKNSINSFTIDMSGLFIVKTNSAVVKITIN